LTIDLFPTSWVFKAGHRARVSIAGADWPTFEILPELSPKNAPADSGNIAPVITVYRDREHPSHILLPIIPRGSD
jgi:predicted acyl esterase